MGLSAGPVEGHAERYASGNRANGSRKPRMLIISVGFASVVAAGVLVAGAAVLNYKPVQQHVEVEITPPNR